MNFWDKQFSVADFKYGTLPNAFLLEQAKRLKPRSEVLLPGYGEGRNSVWLAQQGHLVTAVDSSTVGLGKARSLAEQRGVSIKTLHADLEQWVPEVNSYDAIVLIYLHLPPDLRPLVQRNLIRSLRSKGVFILEAFHPQQLNYQSGGPKAVEMLYTLDKIRADLKSDGLNVVTELLAWEGEVNLDEGSGHHGPAYVTRFVARRD